MNRTTIDIGIDLGTTNSAIALLKDVTPEIIKNNRDQDITPSAVGFTKKGALQLGESAKGMFVGMKDAYVEFKRRMGTEFSYSFPESGQSKKPEELSAEVLKALRGDVERKTGEQIQSAVITVPAAFELHQCDATRKAAELAGLKGSPLLQEPVAAALAYGFQVDSEKAYWLVYDFGGGTFDAALIKAHEGLINVVHHGGDNFLGGSDIDWAILERIVAPRLAKNYDLPDFKRGNTKWEAQLRTLKHFIEIAKVELTTKETASLLGCSFEDDSGDEVDCEEIALTRTDVVNIAEPIIKRSIEICQKVLHDKNLNSSAVQKVILVGGPTKAPYFREILKASLGIPIDYSVDPLTVVAKGAAVFAGTQKLDAKLLKPAQAGEFQIDLKYKPVGHETDPIVGGKVSSPSGDSVAEFTIELVNMKSQWRSGRITLRSDGAFMFNLHADKGERNNFSIELFDASGWRQKTVPDHLVYTVGAVIEEQPLINSIGVALAGNDWDRLALKGSGLPLKMKRNYRTAKPIKVGETDAAITIPLIEGDNERADRNRLIGSYNVTSELIKRDLPAGSEVEITLKIDASRLITVVAYVSDLDEEYQHQFDLRKVEISPTVISDDFESELKRLRSLMSQAQDAQEDKVADELVNLRSSDLVKEIKEAVAASNGDPDAAEKAEKRLLEFKLKLDAAEAVLKWPALVAEINDWLEDLNKLVAQHGSDEQQDRYDQLRKETDQIINRKEVERLSKKLKQVQDLYYQILFSLSSFWVNQFRQLENKRSQMTDLNKAERLFDMGQRYLQEDNASGIRNVVGQLWELLPRQVAEAVKRGVDSTLTR
jgi:molecular chaperone DnaK